MKPLLVFLAILTSCQSLPPPQHEDFPGLLPRPPMAKLGVFTLNLHTWQETQAEEKLGRIAKMIAVSGVDIVTLQEVGQHEEAEPIPQAGYHQAPFQDPEEPLYQSLPKAPGNAALMIVQQLEKDYGQKWSMVWTWSHMGFGVYQEGLAILTKHRLTNAGNKYVSSSVTPQEIGARKVLWADLDVPGILPLRVFSAHLGWGADQIPQIRNFKTLSTTLPQRPTLIGGDFNLGPDEASYPILTGENKWRDDYYAVNPDGFEDSTMGKRIDYILSSGDMPLVPLAAQRYFREEDDLGPRVSDHAGVIVWYN